MKINNYLDHNKLRVCSSAVYQHSKQQQQECVRRPHNFHLITMIKAHICFHRLCIFITFFFFFVAEIAAFTDDGQFESTLVE